ncbi:MAG: succinylglutamate desuccinylase/aspartoacylase family protein [Fibrobacteres bacterium]|nr:succinylglutamate desuccinylase/aspartoacylase family protein [Fibrobacterota bacterium]
MTFTELIAKSKKNPGKIFHTALNFEGVKIPAFAISGKKTGRHLHVHSAQHASEYSGTNGAGWLIDNFDFSKIAGTFSVIPLLNIPQIMRVNSIDKYQEKLKDVNLDNMRYENINRRWPGDSKGTWEARLAYFITRSGIAEADCILDFHSCRLNDYVFTEYASEHKETLSFAKAFGSKLIVKCDKKTHYQGVFHKDGAYFLKKPVFMVEMAPTAFNTNMEMVKFASTGLLNVMKHMKMLAGKPILPKVQVLVERGSAKLISPKKLGYFIQRAEVGQYLKKGELLGTLRSLDDFRTIETFKAPFNGAVVSCGTGRSCVVKPGEEVATFARCVVV